MDVDRVVCSRGGIARRCRGHPKGQDLGERAPIGHPALLEEGLSRLTPARGGEGQTLSQGARGVITQAVGIGHGAQAPGEGTGCRGALIDRVRTDHARLHPAALPRHVAQFGERNETWVPLESLPVYEVNNQE